MIWQKSYMIWEKQLVNNTIQKNILFLSIVMIIFSKTSSAQETEELIITRIYAADKLSPVTYQDINESELQTIDLKEPSFFLQKTPSIISYSDAGSYQGYSYFRLRGIDQTRINMTLDGIPLNEPEDQGVYFSNYPGIFGSLDKIQIQRGVGTSQNGTASYAGSIQLYSIDHSQPGKTKLETSYGSFDSFSGTAEYLSGMRNDKSIYANVSGVKSDGYKYHSGNESYSVFASGIKQDEKGSWRFLGFSGKQENELAWVGVEKAAINENPRNNANTPYEKDRYQQSLVSIAREQKLDDNVQLEVRAYYNHLDGSYDFDFNNFIGLDSTDELYNYALNADFYGAYSNLHYKTDTYDFTAGIHINNYKRDHIGSENITGELYRNTGYRDSYAAFVKYNYYIGDWNLFTDIQYRYSDFDYKGNVDFGKLHWHFTNPRLGTSYQFTESVLAYYSLGKTGREPTRTDLFGGMDNLELNEADEPALFIVDPESVVNHELGLRYQTETMSGNVNIFYMDFDKEITLNGSFGPNGLLLNQDVDQSIRKGIEATLDWQMSASILWKNAISYTHAEIKDNSESFSPVMTPEWIGLSALEYQHSNFTLGMDVRYQDEAYINLANTEKVRSYSLVNVYGIYRQSSIEYQLSINNLFDKSYFASGMINASSQPAYFVGVPINYSFSIKAAFE